MIRYDDISESHHLDQDTRAVAFFFFRFEWRYDWPIVCSRFWSLRRQQKHVVVLHSCCVYQGSIRGYLSLRNAASSSSTTSLLNVVQRVSIIARQTFVSRRCQVPRGANIYSIILVLGLLPASTLYYLLIYKWMCLSLG